MNAADRARRTLVNEHGLLAETAELAVKVVLDELVHPDATMIAAGAAELATPSSKPTPYYRELAGVVWRAMLYRVDR
jgi:hypothetical protein